MYIPSLSPEQEAQLSEEGRQAVEWRVRLLYQLLDCRDPDVFHELLSAGLHQAEDEAIKNCIDIAQKAADKSANTAYKSGLLAAIRFLGMYRTMQKESAGASR